MILSLAPSYFTLAVLATWVMYMGVIIPVRRAKPITNWHKDEFVSHIGTVQYENVIVTTFWVSVFIGLSRGLLTKIIPNTAFLWLLLSQVSYVALLASGIVRSKQFTVMLVVLTAFEIMKALQSTIFHPAVFFLLIVCCVVVFSKRYWPPWRIAVLIMAVTLSIYLLQCIKGDYRAHVNWGIGTRSRALVLYKSFLGLMKSPKEIFSEKKIGMAMDRFDQSQIVGLIMFRVPKIEPYAKGETILNSIYAALVPRVLAPNKYRAGGEYFFRFTGYESSPGTSINIGQLGELYANFGPQITVIACGVYAFLLGLMWMVFHNRGIENPLWMAWFTFIALFMIKCEDGMGEITNHVVKSAFVAFVIIKFVPAWQELLGIKLRLFRERKAKI
jgi:hypothetical protein